MYGSTESTTVYDGRLRLPRSEENGIEEKNGGEFIKSIVYGAVDGVLTSFALISGGVGGSLAPHVVLVLGISSLFANAVSMGIGDIISSLSYREHVKEEREREKWEFEHFLEGEVKEMVDLYESRGLPRDKAEVVVAVMSKYKEFFLDVMVTEELGLKIPDQEEHVFKGGLATGLSFFVFGLLPLISYVVLLDRVSSAALLHVSIVSTLLTLFILGALKSRFSVISWWKSGFEFCFLGGLVALAAYVIGSIVATVVKDMPAAL